ncbi:cyclin-L1-1 isoform X2 [Trifolium pratense]|uniref:cyclin-L1-1 isoform X2 n=1 Tax=Trifolium pratense TaxID=57577 RepID=UPI001E6938BA|nr:cyclin-L1-1 isoform X2 [Trifolium pratense]
MIYTAIDTFYLTDEQLTNTPSRKDGIDEATETTLRIYGCDLIQESGILLRLPQAVMATGQVLFHRFYCKKSFARFNVKVGLDIYIICSFSSLVHDKSKGSLHLFLQKVAASCVWLASKLEENTRKARQVLIIFHRMECRRENLPIDHLDLYSKKYADLKMELSRTERHILKEMGFICHVEHPHKFISNYLATLETPPELRQEAWNLANDSLRTTLCVRFKSEVVACGVVYAAARRFQVPLPENPPWWKAFDAEKSGIDEVCRVLAHLYSLPKAQYLPICKEWDSFTFSNKSLESKSQSTAKDAPQSSSPVTTETSALKGAAGEADIDLSGSKVALVKQTSDKLNDARKSDDESKGMAAERDVKDEHALKSKQDRKMEASGDLHRDRDRERDRLKSRDRDRGRDSDKEREREEFERAKLKDRGHRSRERPKDSGHSEKSRRHSSHDRDRDYYSSSYSSREKDRHRHH